MQPMRWGIVSTAKIGRQHVIPAIAKSPLCDVFAIASRSQDNAQRVAKEFSISKAYGSYDALLADADVEAVYIPLPNHLHVDMATRAARAGKHVLCEKPLGLTAADAGKLIDVRDTTGVHIEEAFMIRSHPQWHEALRRVTNGDIGERKALQVLFSYFNDDPANVRNKADIGGGALLDIGCYGILAARLFFAAEPLLVMALVDRDPAFGTDRMTSVLLEFKEGHAQFIVSTQMVLFQTVQMLGTQGRVQFDIPFNAIADQPSTLRLDKGTRVGGLDAVTVEVPAADQYTHQAEAFVRVIREGAAPAMPLEDSLANMRVIDAVFRSANTGQWESPAA